MKTNEEYRVLQREIDGLNAQNAVLIGAINHLVSNLPQGTGGLRHEVAELINKATVPAQCLAQVKHDAMMEAAEIASNACLMLPDGGSPLEVEVNVCNEAYYRIKSAAEHLLTQEQDTCSK